MPLDWWLAFLVFLLGACLILLVAISRTVRRRARTVPREQDLGSQPQSRAVTPTAEDLARARPAPYLAYTAESQADPLSLNPQPTHTEAPADPDTPVDTAEPDHSTTAEAAPEAVTHLLESDPEPTPQPAAAVNGDASDLPWWEQSFVHNPPPISTITTSARPWHSDGPLPELPAKPRPNIYALLTAGARSSTTVTTGAVKGNRSSGLYHTVDSPWYSRTKADEWFDSPRKAEAAGYSRWDSRSNRNTG